MQQHRLLGVFVSNDKFDDVLVWSSKDRIIDLDMDVMVEDQIQESLMSNIGANLSNKSKRLNTGKYHQGIHLHSIYRTPP